MGRLDDSPKYYIDSKEFVEDNGITSIIKDFSKKENKIVLWDADSLLFILLYSGKDETGSRLPEYTEKDIDILKLKFDEIYHNLLDSVKKYFNITGLFMFVAGRNNFRKIIYSEYKKNRPERSELSKILFKYIIEKYNMIVSDGYEADDYLYTASCDINHEGIIMSADNDLNQIPGIHFNYMKNKWYNVTEEEALYHTAYKLMVGDTSDGVNLSPKIGDKYAKKHIYLGMSKCQYIKQLYLAYVKAWKGDTILAKNNLKLAYQLIRLHNITEHERVV
jgi:5'-3' exonuclease